MGEPPRPTFERPPVQEVAIGVYFQPLAALDAVRFGLLWERWRDRYPRAQEQSPLPFLVGESFDQPTLNPPIIFGPPGSSRVWFLSSDEDQLVQVQRDRLVHNWRRLRAEQPYPHYDTLRPRLEQDAADFWEFLAEQEGDMPVVTQAELTYVNPIRAGDDGAGSLMSRLLAPWSAQMSDDFLAAPEEVSLTLRYRIPGPDGNPVGRLYITAQPALQPSLDSGRAEQVIMLQLFARGAPIGTGLPGALAFLDLGHDWVVRGFKSITTPAMHMEWGLKSDD